ncbi:MAG: PfkB family carbohydrate kinase [Patescibacteria group bacterium]
MNKQITFASLGDLCIDDYQKYGRIFPGGTAFNTAVHASKTGAQVSVFSVIGTDKFAQTFQNAFKLYDIDSSQVQIVDGQTSSIKISIDNKGQPTYSDWELGVLKNHVLTPIQKAKLKEYDIAKMAFFKPLRTFFNEFSQLNLPLTLKVADFAGSSIYSSSTLIIERYIKNFDIVIKSLNFNDFYFFSFLQELSIKNEGKIVLILLGEKGSIAFLDGKQYQQPSIKAIVKDANGAGDAYIACFLDSYLRKKNIAEAMFRGAKAATEKISKIGTIV